MSQHSANENGLRAQVEALHYRIETRDASLCHECWKPWPCKTVALLPAVDAFTTWFAAPDTDVPPARSDLRFDQLQGGRNVVPPEASVVPVAAIPNEDAAP